MLKITTEKNPEATKFKLEGKLAGPWVDELERSWYATATGKGKRITVDLSEVTFIDAEGKKLLAWMYQQGAALQAAGCMTKCIVEEIERGCEAPPL